MADIEWHQGHWNTIAKRLRKEREVLERNIEIAEKVDFPDAFTVFGLEKQIYAINNVVYAFSKYFAGKCANFDSQQFIERCGYKP